MQKYGASSASDSPSTSILAGDALSGCGAWFQRKDSCSNWCWCPQCQIELQEPDEAIQSWLSRDPRYHTERWQEAEGLTQEKAAELMRTKWINPAGGPERARSLDAILQGPPPPPGLAPQAPPGLGGPPPASSCKAAPAVRSPMESRIFCGRIVPSNQ